VTGVAYLHLFWGLSRLRSLHRSKSSTKFVEVCTC
jgi:hypothetical protein